MGGDDSFGVIDWMGLESAHLFYFVTVGVGAISLFGEIKQVFTTWKQPQEIRP